MHAAASPWPRAPVGQDFPPGRRAAEIWRLGDACFLCESALQRGVSIEQDPEWMQGKAGTARYRMCGSNHEAHEGQAKVGEAGQLREHGGFRLCPGFWPTTSGRRPAGNASRKRIPGACLRRHGRRIGESIPGQTGLARRATGGGRRCYREKPRAKLRWSGCPACGRHGSRDADGWTHIERSTAGWCGCPAWGG